MHSDPAEIQKSIRTYMMVGAALLVFTAITVGASFINLGSVGLTVTVALIIAAMKASMVGAVFMHLSHEKRWIYGSLLLTAAFFIVLMAVPFFTEANSIGTDIHVPPPAAAEGAPGAH
jgi:caa(3)-type oxidase subunit IV